ncbi:MAG: D-alanyl-D-alanine carboxypeptidase family protein [Bacillota bacterium]
MNRPWSPRRSRSGKDTGRPAPETWASQWRERSGAGSDRSLLGQGWVRLTATVVALGAAAALWLTGGGTGRAPGRGTVSGEPGREPEAGVQSATRNTPDRLGFDVAAPAAILIDGDTGQVLFEKNADMPVHPASIVKIMTMLVTMDAVKRGHVSLNDPVRISRAAEAMGGSQVYLVAGETWRLEQLMEALAIASANDAAVAIAEHVAGTEAAFVELMNRRAQELGMRDTRFTNSHGLPPEQGEDPNITTARDIAIMSKALVSEHPEVLTWTSIREKVFREQPRFVMFNTNRLVGTVEGVDGLKTGHTADAGFSLAATASRDGRRLIAALMKMDSDQTRVDQASRLLEFGFRAYRPVVVALADEKVGELRLRSGQPEAVPVRATRTLHVLTLGGDPKGVSRRLVFRDNVAPPITKGQQVGWVVAELDGREVARVPVSAGASVRPVSGATRLWRWLRDVVGVVIPGSAIRGVTAVPIASQGGHGG